MATTYLTRTTGTSTSQTKCTFSGWYKRGALTGVHQHIFSIGTSSGAQLRARFRTTDAFQVYGNITGQGEIQFITNRLFRDTSAWYHILISIDCTQSAANRVKIYVNGIEETSFDGTTQAEITSMTVLDSNTFQIGRRAETADAYFDGSMSHFHFIDGTAYDPTAFGSTDSTTGEWKINTSPSVTYGNNGFFILKDGNTITDSSPNSNNFTLGAGTLTKTEDCPSNVFCTWNPNYRSARKDMTLTNGNTFIFEQNSGDSGVSGTIAVSSGKWYWEQIIAQVNGTNAAVIGGLHTTEDFNESPTDANTANTCGLRANGNAYKGTTNLGNFTSADPNGDIFGIAFDADNGSVYYWKNGTALNSGNAIITGLDMTKTWVPFGVQHGGARVTTSTNWGNGYFQTTAVSSAGTNASNNGIFEYDVPTGYTALSTKGLNL